MKKLIVFFSSNGGRIVLTILIYACTILFMSLIGGLSDYLPQSELAEAIVSVFSMIVVGTWTVFGWKALSAITPDIFLFMPLIGWVIYFVLKGLLSLIVGIFVGPYYISKSISCLIKNKY